MFDQKLFNAKLTASWLGHDLVYKESLRSTSTFAKNLNLESSMHGTMIIADQQLAGRGQYDRSWTSKKGKNLTFSLIFEPAKQDGLTLLTLACSLSIAQLIQNLAGKKALLKWPNDVMIGDSKIAGVLTETQFNGSKLRKLIIGIGLNVNQTEFKSVTASDPTSFKLITGEEQSRETLLAELISRIEYNYGLWSRGSVDLMKLINSHLIGYCDWVKIEINNEVSPLKYKFMGVDGNGACQVLDEELNILKYDHEQVRIIQAE